MTGTINPSRELGRRLNRRFELQLRACELLDIIAAEFQSDPTSVQCFDLRTVAEAIAVVKELRTLQL